MRICCRYPATSSVIKALRSLTGSSPFEPSARAPEVESPRPNLPVQAAVMNAGLLCENCNARVKLPGCWRCQALPESAQRSLILRCRPEERDQQRCKSGAQRGLRRPPRPNKPAGTTRGISGIRSHGSQIKTPGSFQRASKSRGSSAAGKPARWCGGGSKGAPTTCLRSRRPPSGGPCLACVVTSSPTWSGRWESNPRQPAWKEEGHPSKQA
jgi:hypothetical protein